MGQIKIKRGGRWIDADDLAAVREAERAAQKPPAESVDLAKLPGLKDLDGDRPLAALGDRCPEVRRYVTANGEMRGNLSSREREIAKEILKRYGERA